MNDIKKSLGQHWLHDESILDAIVEAADIQPGDNVLEVGPGKGTLTQQLLEAEANVTALEFDQDLIPLLKKRFEHNTNCDNVAILEGDIRTFDYLQMPEGYKIVANIPYYLTSHLIRSISETSNPPSIAVLLIQKEVAQRLCAGPGKMGILSVTAQYYFECSLGVEAPAHLFTPPPKVDSQVVVLRHRSAPLFDVDAAAFFALIKAGFSGKRKTLRNSLSGGLQITKDEAEKLLGKAGIDSGDRAQKLSLDEWHKLFVAYNGQHGPRYAPTKS